MVPRLLREARDRGWWDPEASSVPSPEPAGAAAEAAVGEPVVVPSLDAAAWSACSLAARVVAPFDAEAGLGLIAAAIADGAIVSAALVGTHVVGLAVAGPVSDSGHRDLLALGVDPGHRRTGLAGALLVVSPADYAEVTLAERDPVEPIDRTTRAAIAGRLLERAGFSVSAVDGPMRAVDPLAIRAAR
jgi:GNAT superfamily N-acetyltransferase